MRTTPVPPRPRRLCLQSPRLLALAALMLALATSVGRADVCSSCPEPTLDDLKKQSGFDLKTRTDDDGRSHEDYVQTDGGECTYALADSPSVSIGKSWLVLRGTGSVWNCPWGESSDVISIEIADGDSTEWKVTGEVSAEVQVLALKIGGSVGLGVSAGRTVTEVKSVSKTIRAAMGHVLGWDGYFELADVTMDMQFAVSRRFAWWTKNTATGHEVLQQGNVQMECGVEDVRLTRQASIGYSFHLSDSPCDGRLPPTDLGSFPRPLPAPTITPGEDLPEAGGEDVEGPTDALTDEPFGEPEPLPEGEPGPIDEPDGVPEPLDSGDLPVPPTGPLPALPEVFGEAPPPLTQPASEPR